VVKVQVDRVAFPRYADDCRMTILMSSNEQARLLTDGSEFVFVPDSFGISERHHTGVHWNDFGCMKKLPRGISKIDRQCDRRVTICTDASG